MSFYDTHILPHVIACACSQPQIMKKRSEIVPLAQGRVLEIGSGSGTNFSFYDPARVERLFALEPSEGMRRKCRSAIQKAPIEIEMIDLPGEAIPLDDNSIDTVVLTYTLCTIPDAKAALAQMHRVLKPGGRLLVSEHGLSAEPGIAKWQRRIEPLWKPIAGGCHLTRQPDQLIEDAGFRFEQLSADYLPKSPKFAAYNYSGCAVIA